LQQLHYPHEVTAIEEVGIDRPEVKDGELELAVALVQQSAAKTFRPERYEDEVRERVKALIARKIEGQDITEVPAQSPKAQVIDLMAALKASLGMGSEDAEERTPGDEPDAAGAVDEAGPAKAGESSSG
jgi:DNA end-binding protein Ku